MKKTKDIKKLRLSQQVIRTLTSAELKTVIGAAAEGCNSGTSDRTKQEGITTC